jgi:hypothetical protein
VLWRLVVNQVVTITDGETRHAGYPSNDNTERGDRRPGEIQVRVKDGETESKVQRTRTRHKSRACIIRDADLEHVVDSAS